jgi:hypothetical protein
MANSVIICQFTLVNYMASANRIELNAIAKAKPSIVPVKRGGETCVIEIVMLDNSRATLRILTICLTT